MITTIFLFPVLDSILFDLLYTIIIISSKSLFNFINDNSKLSFVMSESIVANEKLKKKRKRSTVDILSRIA